MYELTKKKLGVEKSGFQFVAAGITGILSTFIHDFILTPYDGKYKILFNINMITIIQFFIILQ